MFHKDVTRPDNVRIDMSKLSKEKDNKLALRLSEHVSLDKKGSECNSDPGYNFNQCVVDSYATKYESLLFCLLNIH